MVFYLGLIVYFFFILIDLFIVVIFIFNFWCDWWLLLFGILTLYQLNPDTKKLARKPAKKKKHNKMKKGKFSGFN